jgi:DivIVA domain-containing protein
MTQPGPGDGPRLTVHRVRRGYRTQDVDAFLAEVTAAIQGGRPMPSIAGARFEPAYGGYDEREVDDFLDELARALGQQG